MTIASYQIHNVLNNFSKRLFEEGGGRLAAPGRRPGIYCDDIAAEGKRRAVTAAVTTEIFKRLTRSAMHSPRGEEKDRGSAGEPAPAAPSPTEFTYLLIDAGNRRAVLTFSVEDPVVFIGRLEDDAASDDESGSVAR